MTKFYQRRKLVSGRELPWGDVTVENTSPTREEESSEDDDVEDGTYVSSPQAYPHGRGKGLGSGSGAARDEEIEEEAEEDNDDGDDEVFDVEEIRPRHMLTWDLLCSGLLQTLHGGWRLATKARLSLWGKRGRSMLAHCLEMHMIIDFTLFFSRISMSQWSLPRAN
jgi:hypothetical protein